MGPLPYLIAVNNLTSKRAAKKGQKNRERLKKRENVESDGGLIISLVLEILI